MYEVLNMMKHSFQIALFAFFIMVVSSAANAAASIDGYSPVAYFTEGQAVMGDPAYASEYDGQTYYFQNAEEVEIFNAEPETYAPRFSTCAYSLTLGRTMPIDPTNFKIVGGHLLLFHRSDSVDALALFEGSKLTEEELLERADKEYQLLEF